MYKYYTISVNLKFDFSEEKDLVLRETRGVGFEEIIKAIEDGKLKADFVHPNPKKFPGQRIYIVELNKYIYVVPYIIDKKRKVRFLKTLYPSRKMKNIYLKEK